MKKALALTVVVGVAVLWGSTLASAGDTAATKTYKLSATMNTKQVVTVKSKPWKVPAVVANAKGTFVGTFDDKTRKLTWRITYTGIGKSTIVLADIHLGQPGKFGQFIARLCNSCTSGQKGVETIKRSFVTDLTSGNNWVTIKTDRYPNGVIRGQIKVR